MLDPATGWPNDGYTFVVDERFTHETHYLAHRTAKNACAACTVGCEHHYRTTDGTAGGAASDVRLEYEPLFALGSLCGVDDPNLILRAAALCDRYGMDAISAGGTIAWAMECAEQRVDLGVPAGDVPRFGDGEALARTVEAIGERRGIGELLADGSRPAAARTGQGSAAWAMHVKGLEPPGTTRASCRRWRSGWRWVRAGPVTTARPPTTSISPTG